MRPPAFLGLLLMTFVLWTAAPAAHAQLIVPARAGADGWLVLPTRSGDVEAHGTVREASASDAGAKLEQAADTVTEVLTTRVSSAWDRKGARTRFEERHSSQPATLTARDIDRWTERSRSALRNLARADYEAAQRDLIEAQDLTAGAIEELNREAAQARQLLDTCLYLARALFEAGHRDAALDQVRLCRARSPKASPSEGKHTPETLELMRVVDRELDQKPLGKLFIDSVPRACTVRLNGFDYGATPRVISGVMQGEYRVQVECARPGSEARGRLYRVAVGEGEARVSVDAAFDAAVLSQPALALRYATEEEEEMGRVRHARLVAQVLGASHVLLLTPLSPEALRLDRLDLTESGPRVSASVIVPFSDELSTELAQEAVQVLLAQLSLDLRQAPVASIQPWQPPHYEDAASIASSAEREALSKNDAGWSQRLRVLGYSLVGLGAVGVAGSFALFVKHRDDGLVFRETVSTDTQYLERQEAWQDSRPFAYVAMAPAVVAASSGAALLMQREQVSPVWGWSSGAVATGLLAWGFTDIARGDACKNGVEDRNLCVVDQERRDRGALLVLSALPFAYVPLHQLVFARETPPAVGLGFDARRKIFTMSGAF